MKNKALGLFLLAVLITIPFQGTRPFEGRDEHRYPETARAFKGGGKLNRDFLSWSISSA